MNINIIKYLKNINFPEKKFIGMYSNLNLLKKYKKKFLLDQDKKLNDSNIDNLFIQSIPIISQFQKNMLNKNYNTCITGGSAIKLYSILYNDKIKSNNKLIKTNDFDIFLFYEDKITNLLIINYIFDIIDSIYKTIQYPNFMYLELNIILDFKNLREFNKIIKILFDEKYDLYLYKPESIKNIYYFKFLKVINKEFCIKINIKFVIFSQDFIGSNKNAIIEIYNYYFDIKDNFKLKHKFIPIELIVSKKCNDSFLKPEIKIENNLLYILSEKTILYNIINLIYKYEYLQDNISIKKKKEESKNKRDNDRLDYFFNLYYNVFYKNTNKDDRINILKKIRLNIKKFNKSITKIKNLNILDKFL